MDLKNDLEITKIKYMKQLKRSKTDTFSNSIDGRDCQESWNAVPLKITSPD